MASRHALVVAALTLCSGSAAAVPTTVTYAGVLADNGVPVNATVDVEFTIFDDAVAGNVLYDEDDPGTVVLEGQLVVELGKNNLDDALLDAPNLFLEVRVDSDVLGPRVRLSSVPFALRAAKAQEASVADALGSLAEADVVTQSQLITLHLDTGITAGTGLTFSGGTISIAAGGVGLTQLAANSVDSSKVVDGTIAGIDLAANSVDRSKILDGTITDSDINAAAGILGSKLLSGSVGTTQLATNAITKVKLGGGQVTVNVGPAACGGVLTSATSCKALACGVSGTQVQFLNCSTGNCTATSSANCTATPVGLLIGLDMPN